MVGIHIHKSGTYYRSHEAQKPWNSYNMCLKKTISVCQNTL
nr:MAG TPA: hypothetical protein [Caudoviricetes sp.]